MLINSGSTHNFIQESVVSRLGYAVESLPPFKVFIGSREYLVCKDVCRQVEISLQNTLVTEDLFVLPMGGANIVLRIQWLGTLGLVTTDHRKLTMEFQSENLAVRLQGESQLAEAEISNSGLRRLLAKEDVAYFFHLRGDCPDLELTQTRPELVAFLDKFADVLAEPWGLPPEWPTDHKILWSQERSQSTCALTGTCTTSNQKLKSSRQKC